MRQRDLEATAADEAIDLERLSTSILIAGVLSALLAAAGVRWPEPGLVLAMVAAGGVIGTFGIFDLAAAVVSGTVASIRAFFVGHGLASVGFGVLTASIPVASPETAHRLSIVWLALYAIFLALLSWRLWFHPRARHPLIAWCLVNSALAVALGLSQPMTTNGLLYAASVYTCVLGVGMVVAGLTIQHDLARRYAAGAARQ